MFLWKIIDFSSKKVNRLQKNIDLGSASLKPDHDS